MECMRPLTRVALAAALAAVSLCVVSGSSATVSLFKPRVDYPAGAQPYAIATADFNNDGKPDLAVANNYSSDVSVLIGNGNGTFAKQTRYATQTSDSLTDLAVGDLNGDGNSDLVVGDEDGNGVIVLIGNGDGSFQVGDPACVDHCSEAFSVALGHFNDDSNLDLVVGNDHGLSVLLGNGDGTFQAPVDYPASGVPFDVAVADLNGDGNADLEAGFESTDAAVYLGNGDGTFDAGSSVTLSEGSWSVVVKDLNGDGKPDLAATEQTNEGNPGSAAVALGNGDGTFGGASYYATGMYPTALDAGDVNGDGIPDLVVANRGESDLSVLLGNGDGTFQPQLKLATPNRTFGVTVGDLNADGGNDVAAAVGDPCDCVSVFLRDLQSPAVSLTASPNPALTGDTVTFTADASTTSPVADYAWDLDGNGSFETDTGTTPTASHTYSDVGDVTVGVQVTDSKGNSGTDQKVVSVRLTPPSGPVGMSIDNGAIFTNDPQVKINAVWPAYTKNVVISNDGGFQHAKTKAVKRAINWTLQSSGSERLPKAVYIRFDDSTQTFSDDIILDESAPQTQASLKGHVLHIRAKDTISGVKKLQVRRGHKIIVTKHYGHRRGRHKVSKTLHVRGKKLYVRAFDAAGNRSHWRKVRRAD
jgi:hypothetical protein